MARTYKYRDDPDVNCPFYRTDDGHQRLVCECCISNAESITHFFKRRAEFDNYKRKYCIGDHMNCLLYWANLDGFERREKHYEQSD